MASLLEFRRAPRSHARAAQRLRDIEYEIARILRAFPVLRMSGPTPDVSTPAQSFRNAGQTEFLNSFWPRGPAGRAGPDLSL